LTLLVVASIERLEEGPSGADPLVLAASVALSAASVVMARFVKRGETVSVQDV
jgi:hypothetical protein